MDILEACSKTYNYLTSFQGYSALSLNLPQVRLNLSMPSFSSVDLARSIKVLASSKHVDNVLVAFKKTINPTIAVSKKLNDHLVKIVTVIQRLILNIIGKIDDYKAFIIGPSISLAVAGVVRLSLGKRVPTSGPLYISAIIAIAALITVWAVQFFKHPKHQKMVQNKGVAGALVHAIPFAKPRIIEPMHSRHFMSQDRLELLLQKPGSINQETVTDLDARGVLSGFKLYCDWVKKKIKLTTANADTLSILKNTLSQHFTMTLKNLVVHGNPVLLKEFLAFEAQDAFVTKVLTLAEKMEIYHQFGSRLSFLISKPELAALFPEPDEMDLTISCMDAIVAGNADRVIDLTNTGGINATKVIVYGDSGDVLLSKLNFKLPPMNLVQGSIVMGDVASLQRILASLPSPIDWYQTDARGLNLLVLAALSGSKAMWDFVREFYTKLPKEDSRDYLNLIYATMKGKNLSVFNELIAFCFEESYKELTGAFILDLYEKALSFNADEFIEKLKAHESLEEQLKKRTSIKSILTAAIRGGKVDVVSANIANLSKVEAESALLLKELYEQACRAEKPSNRILAALRDYETSIGAAYVPAGLDLSSQDLASCASFLDNDQLTFILSRIPKEQIVRSLSENGMFFQRIIKRHEVLAFILEKCSTEKFLKVACAKEAIKMNQADTLRMLCETGLDTIKKLPDSHESLLSYAMLSFKPLIIQIILSTCPSLSSALIAELKARITDLKCHAEDEEAFRHIIRMLDAKSLERASGVVEDPQLHLALVKAGAMDFVTDYADVPKEEASRGLIASRFGFLGLF